MLTARARTTAASIGVAGLMLATFGVATSLPSVSAAATAGAAARHGASGFTAVRGLGEVAAPGQATAQPLRVSGADTDTAFILRNTATGMVVERVDVDGRGRSTSTVTPLQIEAGSDPQDITHLEAGSDRDVWATVNGALFHYDGLRWSRIALPNGYTRATAVLDRPGAAATVALAGPTGPAVFPVNARGNRVTWSATPLGSWGDQPRTEILDLREAGGTWFARVNPHYPAASVWTFVVELSGDTWQTIYNATEYGRGAYNGHVAWLTPSADRHVLLGDPYSPRAGTNQPLCEDIRRSANRWSTTACATKAVSHEGTLLRDGRIITGGFGERPASGKDAERQLTGNVGDGVLSLDAATGTTTAWAVTSVGGKAVLQRYQG